MKTVIIGLDPGSGASSPTGFAAIDPHTMEIHHTATLTSLSANTPSVRMREIHRQAKDLMTGYVDGYHKITVFIESFFIQGRGNQTAQQVIGALKSAAPDFAEVSDIANTTMKKLVGGSGNADKTQVALGVYHLMSRNVQSADKITELIKAEQWDILDALGLALAGWLQLKNPPPPKKPKKKKKKASAKNGKLKLRKSERVL